MPTGVFAATEDWGQAGDADGPGAGGSGAPAPSSPTAMAAMPRTPVVDPFDAPPDFASLLRDASTPEPGLDG